MSYGKRESIERNSEIPSSSKNLGCCVFFFLHCCYTSRCVEHYVTLYSATSCVVPGARPTRQNALLSRPVTFDPCYRGVGPLGINHPNCVRAPFGSFYMDLCISWRLSCTFKPTIIFSAGPKFMAN